MLLYQLFLKQLNPAQHVANIHFIQGTADLRSSIPPEVWDVHLDVLFPKTWISHEGPLTLLYFEISFQKQIWIILFPFSNTSSTVLPQTRCDKGLLQVNPDQQLSATLPPAHSPHPQWDRGESIKGRHKKTHGLI